ncbi:helix-turn-helix domain-containing protein [Sphingobacterium sp. SGR-19]|uniref:hybrid sensor histidine kinase/response regulator transcription factor n=1 Tax=Sphingobacterium sp. SGR-19 TaxID=2710886 RepID=UPI0013ED70A5|nr:helix-turn-helix domain-containing protein [Sphingobacterium sp. SGR-19]NGM65830.1 helix-turn-helix domain-containing protein [Sphingobacterium sp. SGR-19]
MKRYIFFAMFLLLIQVRATAQSDSFHYFQNIPLDAKASTVHAFAQDSLGLLWLGSNNGLYHYDGYTLHAAPGGKPEYQTYIYSIEVLDGSRLALGTERGVGLYNYKKDCYEDLPMVDVSDVRALLLVGDTLWIGSLKGLYTYDIKRKTFSSFTEKLKSELTSQIYALAQQGSKILVGTYNGLFEVTPETASVRQLVLSEYRKGANQFINTILVFDREHTYIGTEYGLYIYADDNVKLLKTPHLQNLPVKSMAKRDAETLLIGTDDGLFVYGPRQQRLQRIKHDARNPFSLANNIIWSVFTSRTGAVWVGTDLGFSGWTEGRRERKFPIYQFTRSSNGNKFYQIWRDRSGWYWLGGDNGLIRTPTFDETETEAYWYRMDAAKYALPHNRVRDIYEDREGLLWVASDGGVSLFDPQTNAFKSFMIVDSSGRKNAKWAYDLEEDRKGNLWVATYMGGIFVVPKERLKKATNGYVIGESYDQSRGLLANFANQILLDHQDRMWVLFYNRGINTIDVHTGHTKEIKGADGKAISDAVFMLIDAEGTVWVGQHGTLLCIAKDGKKESITFDPHGKGEVTAMENVGDHLWVANNVGVWKIDKKTFRSVLVRYGGGVTTLFYRADTKDVLLGGINEVVVLPATGPIEQPRTASTIVLTAMYINNKRFGASGYGLRYRHEIVLEHQQNNLRLEFSDLDYGNQLGHRLAYAFKAPNETWIPLEQDDNRIQLSNLQSGDYTLQVAKIDMLGQVISAISLYEIKVNYPWYATVWAKVIYALAMLGLLLWILNFFRVRNKLKWERRERKKVMELSRMKMDFLTAVSHDLKNPLSLILAPVSQLMLKTKNPDNKKLLDGVHRNAMKINNLIQEVMTFEKIDDRSDVGELITSQLDITAFVERCVNEWKQLDLYKHIEWRLVSDIPGFLIQTDAAKLESMLNNLLSNACKYSKADGTIVELHLGRSEKGIIFIIRDNGIGIKKKDLPYVFSKFYRSAADEVQAMDGTGVGLYLVRNYAGQLGWTVELDSQWMEGTTVTIEIPVSSAYVIPSDEEVERERKKLLIVEDNEELSSFLLLAFENIYDCRTVVDGRAAIDLIDHSFKPDMIVSDAIMPKMDGLEMVRQLRRRTDTAIIPVILLTAVRDEQLQRAGIAAGVDAFVQKPFDLELLKLQMQQLLLKKTTLQTKLRIDELCEPREHQIAVSPDEQLLNKITQVIEDAIDDSDFSVQRLADEAGVSAKQLYRKIKQLTGHTPVTYIRTVRMKKAALLLRQRKFTVAEVMYMVGYSNASYFSKCFQEEFGTTPKNYMEQQDRNTS